MIAYTRDELISVSELAKNPNKILNSIRNSSGKKVAVVFILPLDVFFQIV